MTTFARAQVRKEFRQLLPWWGAIVGGMVAMAAGETWARTSTFLLSPHEFPMAGLLIYAIGGITLGALTFGHEYAHHTLPALLIQPITRTRVLLVKVVALATLLAALAGVLVLAFEVDLIHGGPRSMVLGWVPLLCGLCLAPWVTMVCRGTLAGVVLSAAVTVALFPLGAIFSVPYGAVGYLIVILAAMSAVMAWRTFLQLEAPGGRQAEVDLVGRLYQTDGRVATSRTFPPLWLLIRKELRIQQLTFAVSAIYVLVWVVVTAGRWWAPGRLPEGTLFIASFIHLCLVPLMAGAQASAEERRYGTADWHLLLPMAAWTQWTVKAVVAMGSSVLLAVALPNIMMSLAPEPGLHDMSADPGAVVLACLAALYVSSLCTNGVHALIATPPAIGAAFLVQGLIAWPLISAIGPMGRWFADVVPNLFLLTNSDYQWWRGIGVLWLAAGFSVPLFYFGFVNHSTAERGRRLIVGQAGWFAAYGLLAAVVYSVVSALVAAWIHAGR